uniref:Terminase large subunit n=1 Tax=Vibrio phage Vc1 TaxID=1480731 RepID=A0A6M5CA20_9CAUD
MLIWEDLTRLEKLAIRELSKQDFDTFVKIWFPIQQGKSGFLTGITFTLHAPLMKLFRGQERHHFGGQITGSRGGYITPWIYSGCVTLDDPEKPDDMFSKVKRERGQMIAKNTIRSRRAHSETPIIVIQQRLHAQDMTGFRNLNISFADTLVKRNSKRVRDLFNSPEWQELWPAKTGTSRDDEFQVLNKAGKHTGNDQGGQITGSRGGYITPWIYSGCVTLDDPEKPDDMFSKVKRERGQMIAKNTIRSRRAHSETPIIVIQQRLHAQDMTGFGIEFDRISIPAMVTREYGESLPDWLRPHFENDVLSSESVIIDGIEYFSFWPKRKAFTILSLCVRLTYIHFFLSISRSRSHLAVMLSTWNGSSITEPEKSDSAQARSFRKPDRFDYTVITADTAQKEGELNDYSVLCYWGMYRGKAYFIDGVRGKWEAPALETQFKAFVSQCWNRNKECGTLRKIYVEDKASGTGLIQNCRKAFPIEITPLQRDKDKVTRCMDAQPVIKNGYVILPESHHMLNEFWQRRRHSLTMIATLMMILCGLGTAPLVLSDRGILF